MAAEFLQHLVNGLIIGGTYAMMGIGLTLIFGIMNVVNFAHGEFYMLTAFFLYTFVKSLKLNFLLSMVASVVSIGLLALAWERYILRRLRSRSVENGMLTMIGLSILLQNVTLIAWGGAPRTIPAPFPLDAIPLGPVSLTPFRLFIALTAMGIILGLAWFLKKSSLGKATRATFQDRDTAAAVGINVDWIYAMTFALGSALAGSAGLLLAPLFVITPTMGDQVTAKAFAVAITGGLGNFPGAAFAGLILGVAESLGAAYVSSGYKDAISFLLIIVILVIKPSWLFANRT
ncbi:MAG: branched-chain amino acid ABC transporter permease [Actinobacteria bacterium]|nr:branched-chain amino acid ABC transporter permease [Actinomycetota bacterium]